MKSRLLRWVMIFTLAGGTTFQLGGCLGDVAIQYGTLFFLDTFVGPALGDPPDLLPALRDLLDRDGNNGGNGETG